MSLNLLDDCTLVKLNQLSTQALADYNCDNTDLNEFFKKDAKLFEQGLISKTYAFVLDKDPNTVVCTFAVANDSIKSSLLPNARRKKIEKEVERPKQMRSYPAVMVGRLGVSKNYKKQGIGSQLMDFIKSWFSETNNKTGCRFVVVDAYNTTQATGYYLSNGFNYLFTTDEQEKEYLGTSADLSTRLMYFDLIVLKTL